jgi:hypothetical protein
MSSPAVIRESPLVSASGAFLLGLALLAAAVGCGEREGEDLQPDHRAGDRDSRPQSAALPGAAPSAAGPAVADGDVAALAPLLAAAASTATLEDARRQALEQAMQRVLQPAAAAVCDGCRAEVSYVDEAGGGDHFRGDIRGASGEVMADVEIYSRSDLAPEAAAAWARTTLAGHPASAFGGEHLFVWPGRFEIRAFARGDALRDQRRLADLLSGLPLDALAKL